MHKPLPLPVGEDVDLEASMAAATRTIGNLAHDLACQFKAKSATVKDMEVRKLGTRIHTEFRVSTQYHGYSPLGQLC